ncbi:MAG: STAS domain-containing protein [Candidatus Baltobacteraceae bacterium]
MIFEYRAERLATIQTAVVSAFEAGAARVVLNLDALEHLESKDVRGLILLLRRSREVGGELALQVSRPEILRSLKVMALDRLFTIVTAQEAAA